MSRKPNLKVTIAADTHIDYRHPDPTLPVSRLCRAIRNAKHLHADAFVVVGDITSHGIRTNWDLARGCFDTVRYDAGKIVLALGNHDGWDEGDDGYRACFSEYTAACRDITGTAPAKPYFSVCVNGYSLICLGNESDRGCDADISDEQLAWLRTELETATADGKPAFVFCHQSLNGRHGLPRTWEAEEDPNASPEEGGIGAQSAAVEAILKSYRNVFYFSGHSHMGLCGEATRSEKGYASFETEGDLHLINLPSLACGNHCGEDNAFDIGMVLLVYDDSVVIKPRNFTGERYIQTVKIQDGKPYYAVQSMVSKPETVRVK